jgi:dihydropteroate synthase
MLSLESLAELCQRHEHDLAPKVASFELKGTWFRPCPEFSLMGVVNLSPDSWYRESVVLSTDSAIQRGIRLAAEGAKLIDLGAESTILDAALVNESAQKSTLLPVVSALNSEGILVSVETYHPSVTAACLKAGAAVVNLTSAGDTETHYRLIADYDAAVIICYIQNGQNVRQVGDFQFSDDHAGRLYDYFATEIDKATKAGVRKLWIDPGMGFYYKNLQDSTVRIRHQMNTFLNTFRIRRLGWPVCHALPHAFEFFEEEVRTAEAFFAVLALLGKTDLLRTHEVSKVRGVCRTMAVFG